MSRGWFEQETPGAHEGIILAQTKEKYDFLQIDFKLT